jgi:hypothetical protein
MKRYLLMPGSATEFQFIPETKTIQEIKPHLTLEGLLLLFELNH